MDKIIIRDLLVRGIIGINDWERVKKQNIMINLELKGDLSKVSKSDDINDTVNYRTLTKEIIEYVENSQHFLIETLAQKIADIAFTYPIIESVIVRVEKPSALRFAESVGVEIERFRPLQMRK